MHRIVLLLLACLALAPVKTRADVASDSAAITANAAALAAALAALPQVWQVQCTGAYAHDTPAIQGALSTGASTVRIHGACVTNAALIPVSNQAILGDGACNVVAPDPAYPGKLQPVAAVGACTSITADPATMAATPFNIIDMTGSSGTPIDTVWINGITINGNWIAAGGTINGTGVNAHAGGGIKVGTYGSNVVADAVEITNVGGDGFDVPNGGSNAGFVNSYAHDLWHNCFYSVNAANVYLLGSYLSDCSQAQVPGATSITTWDGADCDPGTQGCVIANTTIIDDDLLGLNHNGGATSNNFVAVGNYVSSPNIVPACGAVTLGGTITTGDVVTTSVTLTVPTTSTLHSYPYTVLAGETMATIAAHIVAAVNASPITSGGTSLAASVAYDYAGGVENVLFSLPGSSACSVTASYTATSLTETAASSGNNGAGGVNTSGPVSSVFLINNYITSVKHYGLTTSGDPTNVHIVGNTINQTTHNSVWVHATSDGPPNGAELYNNTVAASTVDRIGPACAIDSAALNVLFSGNAGMPQNLPPIGPNFHTP